MGCTGSRQETEKEKDTKDKTGGKGEDKKGGEREREREREGEDDLNTPGANEKYTFKRTLGKGASCRVMEASSKKDNSIYAVKIMSKSRPVCKPLYEHEVSILNNLKHPNIICLYENFEDMENYYVITNMCGGGELFDRIVNPSFQITEKIASTLVRDMLQALKFCHDKNIVHRDLKPENFVFEGSDPEANIVLIDFGCAKKVQDDEVYDDMVGTVYYLAPELASQKRDVPTTGLVLKAADIWSVGVIAYVMMTGRPPFGGKSNREIFQKIVNDPLIFPDDVKLSDSFKDFVRKVLVKDPSKRITLEVALEHPWVLGKEVSNSGLQQEVIKCLRQFNYQSKLKKAITRCLAANMSAEPEKEIKHHFTRLDKDGDGYLELNELEAFLLDMGYAPSVAKAEASQIMTNADLNKDGTIDFDEFKAIWQRKLLSQHDEYIHRVFAVFDDNGDGQIDAAELQGVLGDDFKSIVEMINEVDENHDNKISFEEFKKAMQEDVTKLEDLVGTGKYQEHDLV